MSYPLGVTVTLLRVTAGAPDGYGNDTSTTSTLRVTGGAVWPVGSNGEQIQARDTVGTELVWAAPFGTVVKATDQAIVDGYGTKPFNVVGEPFSWTSPLTGTAACVEVRLLRVTG